ncbi:MAG: SusC/RagA family TonB-linked outer membrane protein [Gemmatimonadaceae bacterium]|nr:SusC/RagA family TonB-linked outer membrane protein [Gemmatimonadaceae bacterium]
MVKRRCLGWALLATALLPAVALSQGGGSIVGRVVDAGSQQPIPSAQVAIVGTRMGAVTDQNGYYRIPAVPAGTVTVRAARIGYGPATKTATVPANDSVSVDFALQPTTLKLEQVVVTGTAGNQTRRAQAAVVAGIDVGDLAQQAPVQSVADVLQSRVPGVSLEKSSGTSGTSQSIRIRGVSSISLSNQPLIFIDGVRATARNVTSGRAPNGQQAAGGCSGCDLGGQAQSLLNMIDPNEIERIEIVKGPAAATLYGADASAGVIQIITKRGALNSGGFRQTLNLEYNSIDANYTPPDNYGACTAALVAPTSPNPLCRGQAVGTIIHYNPLLANHVFRTGNLQSASWSGEGGGQNYGYFASAHLSREVGTLPSNWVNDKNARFNFHFQPSEKVVIDAGFGLIWTSTRLPDQGNNPYGFGGALISSPLTLGGPSNGWNGNYRDKDAIAAIDNRIDNTRAIPTAEVRYTPVSWFTNRLTLGADLTRSSSLRLVPKSSLGAYFAVDNNGSVKETRYTTSDYTLNYLGDIKTPFFHVANVESDVSFGVQVISEDLETIWADGLGLATNSAHAVSAAASRSGGQLPTVQQRSVGYLGQWQLAWRDRLFLQFGARLDKNSGFGENVHTFFLPKVGLSYVLSDEPFWGEKLPWVSTMRIRAAYGTTGRAPTPGAADQTYAPCPYVVGSSELAGLCLQNPGNPDLRPEKGTEFEGGADFGFFNDRVGAEVTYFRKTTTDLLLQRPLASSAGYDQSPFVNIGKVRNDGWEVALHAQVLDRRDVSWGVNVNLSTLHNEVLDLGDITPFGTTQRVAPGVPLEAFWGYKINQIDVANHRAVVSDTMQFLGNLLPDFEGSFGTTVGLFHNTVRLYGQLDWKTGYKVLNSTQSFRDRNNSVSLAAVDSTALSPEDRLRFFGPYVTESGTALGVSQVNDPYIQDGDFLRLREVSATVTLPTRFFARAGATSASLTVAGQNLHLWTKYPGPDPEIHANIVTTEFDQQDFLTFPPTRRWVVKLTLGF